jgi:hypothetical protein
LKKPGIYDGVSRLQFKCWTNVWKHELFFNVMSRSYSLILLFHCDITNYFLYNFITTIHPNWTITLHNQYYSLWYTPKLCNSTM